MIFTIVGRYMAMRFIVTILSVFFITFLIIFFADFVENLRRSSSREDIGVMTVATISLLRVPVFAELALPFAVLIGTIGAYLSFSRTSELIIIRASGLSVWQFIQPGLWVAVAFGVFAVTVFNPVASWMKAASERMQTRLFNTERSFGTESRHRLVVAAGECGWPHDSACNIVRRQGLDAWRRNPVAI